VSFSYNGSTSANSIPNITGLTTYSVFVRARRDDSATGVSVFAGDNYPSTPREEFLIKWNPSNTRFECSIDNTGGSTDTTLPSVGVWVNYGLSRNGTTVTPYYAGSAQTGITVGSGTADFVNIRMGCHYYSGGNNEFSNMSGVDFAIWDIDLSAADFSILEAGVSPLLVRPQNLIRYIPAIRENQELINQTVITDIGAPGVSDNPRLIKPSAQILQFPSVPAVGNTITSDITEGGDTVAATLEVDRNVTANITESGDTPAATLTSLRNITANVTESGDTPVGTMVGVVTSAITANVTESGDTIAATLNNVVQITANITEDGDTPAATMVGVLTAAITANVSEAGDTVAANLNVLLQILANVSESGDTVAATVGGLAPDVPGVEYTLPRNKLHYDLPRNRLHYTLKD